MNRHLNTGEIMRILLSLLLFLLPLSSSAKTAVSPIATAKITIHYAAKGGYLFGYLKISNTFVGRIYRGQSRTFLVKADHPFTITFFRGSNLTEKVCVLKKDEKRVVTLTLQEERNTQNKKQKKSLLIIQLSEKSGYNYAHISINREYYGLLRKNQRRSFLLNPGTLKITLYRTKNKIIKRLTLRAGQRRRITLTLKQ